MAQENGILGCLAAMASKLAQSKTPLTPSSAAVRELRQDTLEDAPAPRVRTGLRAGRKVPVGILGTTVAGLGML
jgi:hypothetical protein